MFLVKGMAFDFVLISRRSRYRAGTRYRTRGVDEKGYVANYVETEQILGFCSSSFFASLSSFSLLFNDRTDLSLSLISDNGRVSRRSEDQSHFFGVKRRPQPSTIPVPVSLTLLCKLFLSPPPSSSSSPSFLLIFHLSCLESHASNLLLLLCCCERVFRCKRLTDDDVKRIKRWMHFVCTLKENSSRSRDN